MRSGRQGGPDTWGLQSSSTAPPTQPPPEAGPRHSQGRLGSLFVPLHPTPLPSGLFSLCRTSASPCASGRGHGVSCPNVCSCPPPGIILLAAHRTPASSHLLQDGEDHVPPPCSQDCIEKRGAALTLDVCPLLSLWKTSSCPPSPEQEAVELRFFACPPRSYTPPVQLGNSHPQLWGIYLGHLAGHRPFLCVPLRELPVLGGKSATIVEFLSPSPPFSVSNAQFYSRFP